MNVLLNTNQGDITIELFAEKAPLTVENFLTYVKDGHYDGTIFHRVINGFMIQGGGLEPGMKEKSNRGGIQNEADNGLTNDCYTLAMARTNEPHSASAQFFINVKDNSFLNYVDEDHWGYCVFGKVIAGTEVVDEIRKVRTATKGFHGDVPVEDVIIEKAQVV
jgi:peptidyl-prolyl cis-trans isomerase B (cyclophilin B)